MKDYEQVTRDVFRKRDEYLARRNKRIAYIEKGVSIMSITGIIAALGIITTLSSTLSPGLPEEPSEIDLSSGIGTVTSQTENTAETSQVSTSAQTSTGSVNTTAETTSAVTEGVTSAATANVLTTAAETTVSTTALILTDTAVTTVSTDSPEAVFTEATDAAAEEYSIYGSIYYTADSDSVTIVGCAAHTSALDIPSEIDGLPVTEVKAGAFSDHAELGSITLPDSLEFIGEMAFWGCRSLESIYIPANVHTIERAAFVECTSLTEINVDENSAYYKSDDGVLFSKDGTYLLCCPYSKSVVDYVVPDGVAVISDYAIMGCSSLENVVIPDSVTDIGVQAFYYCENLKDVTVPESVAVIGDRAFGKCPSLSSIAILNPVCEIFDGYNDGETFSENTVIYGYEGSTAQAYAEKYGREFAVIGENAAVLTGDADGNGTVDLSDAVQVLSIYAQNASGLNSAIYGSSIDNAADVNSDGRIDLDDAVSILTYYSRKAAGLDPQW